MEANSFNIEELRTHFPLLKTKVNNHPLVYLDNAATTQKPNNVINALVDYYTNYNSNIHRSAHYLANQATEKFEQSRNAISSFINAPDSSQIIFTRGTTESVNLVAYSYARNILSEGDEVLISALEHHSNLVPWQQMAIEKKAVIKVIPCLENGELNMSSFQKLISKQTKLVAVNHASNSLGTINPVKEICRISRMFGATTFIDGAQGIAHLSVDVQDIDCDFYAFSGHKVFGPTGIGILYGKRELLENMLPFMFGGEMIKEVNYDQSTFNLIPYIFEPGTPHICGAIALGEAIEFFKKIDLEEVQKHEQELLNYTTSELQKIDGLRIIGTSEQKVPIISFLLDKIHFYDIGVMLDQLGIAIRTGHHCCQPLMKSFGIDGTCRVSFSMYNTMDEASFFVQSLQKVISKLR